MSLARLNLNDLDLPTEIINKEASRLYAELLLCVCWHIFFVFDFNCLRTIIY